MTYRDSTDDGIEGAMFDTEPDETESELSFEAERIVDRLHFLTTVAQLWKFTATVRGPTTPRRATATTCWPAGSSRPRTTIGSCWICWPRCIAIRIPAPRGTHESLVEYDRRRSVKDTLLEEIISVCVETADACG